jgi:plasmid stability protein
MAQFVVRNLEEDVRDKLRDLAQSQGQSLEELVREILRCTVLRNETSRTRLGSRLVKRFKGHGLDQELPELRGQTLDPPSLEL